MEMNAKEESALDVHKLTFKEMKRRYAVASFALHTFANNVADWKPAHQAI